MAERFENLDVRKDQNTRANARTRSRKKKKTVFFKEINQKNYSSSLSRQSSEIKSKTKLVCKLSLT